MLTGRCDAVTSDNADRRTCDSETGGDGPWHIVPASDVPCVGALSACECSLTQHHKIDMWVVAAASSTRANGHASDRLAPMRIMLTPQLAGQIRQACQSLQIITGVESNICDCCSLRLIQRHQQMCSLLSCGIENMHHPLCAIAQQYTSLSLHSIMLRHKRGSST